MTIAARRTAGLAEFGHLFDGYLDDRAYAIECLTAEVAELKEHHEQDRAEFDRLQDHLDRLELESLVRFGLTTNGPGDQTSI